MFTIDLNDRFFIVPLSNAWHTHTHPSVPCLFPQVSSSRGQRGRNHGEGLGLGWGSHSTGPVTLLCDHSQIEGQRKLGGSHRKLPAEAPSPECKNAQTCPNLYIFVLKFLPTRLPSLLFLSVMFYLSHFCLLHFPLLSTIFLIFLFKSTYILFK